MENLIFGRENLIKNLSRTGRNEFNYIFKISSAGKNGNGIVGNLSDDGLCYGGEGFPG